jgi:sulfide:quinone oxidoreductase
MSSDSSTRYSVASSPRTHPDPIGFPRSATPISRPYFGTRHRRLSGQRFVELSSKKKRARRLKTIVVGIDGFEPADEACRVALNEARKSVVHRRTIRDSSDDGAPAVRDDSGMAEPSEQTRVLVAGAGIAGLETLLALRELAGELVAIEVVSPTNRLYYRPLLVMEPFRAGGATTIPLAPLLARHGVRYHEGALSSVDASAHTARTGAGRELDYDVLVITCGGSHVEGVTGAVTFPSPGDVEDLRALLDDLENERAKRVAFALPPGAGWALPLYELALMTATELERRCVDDFELVIVTPESDPLGLFGRPASDAVREILDERGIELVTHTYPVAVEEGGLVVRPGGLLAADRVVALSRLEGPRIDGVPQDAAGFIPVDRHGAVVGLRGVYAAGDAVAFPVKQGGIAAQQAGAVAEAIAARAGAAVTPLPFRPVLRGMLLTGASPRYFRSELTFGYGDSAIVSPDPLWWPPAKIAGRYLPPVLAQLVDLEPSQPSGAGLEIDLELPTADEELSRRG